MITTTEMSQESGEVRTQTVTNIQFFLKKLAMQKGNDLLLPEG